jgi:hypothetical protein
MSKRALIQRVAGKGCDPMVMSIMDMLAQRSDFEHDAIVVHMEVGTETQRGTFMELLLRAECSVA